MSSNNDTVPGCNNVEDLLSTHGNLFCDVLRMHRKFGFCNHLVPGLATRRLLQERAACMMEELQEFQDAAMVQDLVKQADALVDLVYFAIGTAVILGLPFQQLWDEVHRANMSKERGATKRGHAVDLMKPEGWTPPNIEEILTRFGFDEEPYCDMFGIVEERCRDH
jgi:predicted HAD superfamily Cof-like phosphohydrolase